MHGAEFCELEVMLAAPLKPPWTFGRVTYNSDPRERESSIKWCTGLLHMHLPSASDTSCNRHSTFHTMLDISAGALSMNSESAYWRHRCHRLPRTSQHAAQVQGPRLITSLRGSECCRSARRGMLLAAGRGSGCMRRPPDGTAAAAIQPRVLPGSRLLHDHWFQPLG